MSESVESINIRPGVSMLSVLSHLNYKPWFALAEFVDNAVQSFLAYRDELERNEGGIKLQVSIELEPTDGGRITIRDNAAGIHAADYPRAFRPAQVPPDRSGLSEFGMGMKSAACWFAPTWSVRTSALGEPVERIVSFDIETIVRDDVEDLRVQHYPVNATAHYTEIVLYGLHRMPQTRTIGKMKEHLASIYRIFLRSGLLVLRFNNEVLAYAEPRVLIAPYYKDPMGERIRWSKPIALDLGGGLRVHGFAALRETAGVSEAGFALFRRDRLIEGSVDEAYRPEAIFGKSNSYTYQRLFGELHLEGFEVSHTKDGFRWEEHEDALIDRLRDALDAGPLPLRSQAEGHRVRLKTQELRSGAQIASDRTAAVIKREAPQVLQHQIDEPPETRDPEPLLPPTTTASRRVIDLHLDTGHWQIELELSNDPGVGEWVALSDQPSPVSTPGGVRHVGVRLGLAHPFMERFGGTEPAQIEPLLRLAVALVLAEITARESGVKMAGTIRRNINELLRNALSKP